MKGESSKLRGARQPEPSEELTADDINRVLIDIVRNRVPCTIQFQEDSTVRVKLGPYRTGPAKQAITKTFDEAVRWLHDQLLRQTESEER